MKTTTLFVLSIFALANLSFSQSVEKKDSTSTPVFTKPVLPEIKDIEIIQMLQLWDVNTFENAGNTAGQNRNDLYIRRGRIGARAKLRKDLSFWTILAYDGIGKDEKTASAGAPNPADNHDVFLWEMASSWTPKPMFNVTFGYFRPQIGRENITAAFNCFTLEKSLPNFQPRLHFIGRNTGRETGINIGGLYSKPKWGINYNFGAFDMTNPILVGTGNRWFPLLAARVAFTLGDAEMDKYKINYTQSYYGQRNGVTLALNGTYQGKTEIFKSNSFYGVDLLANFWRFDFVAEYDLLVRNSIIAAKDNNTFNSTDKVYSFKACYNHILSNGKIIQAAFMYSGQLAQDHGAKVSANDLTAATDQKVYDAGVNYLINKDKLKLSLHYVWGEKSDKNTAPKYSYLCTGLQYLF